MRRLLFAVVAFCCALPSSAIAYEGDHYAWTYYLALQVGFTKRQALQIASGAYALDWDPDTGPMEAYVGDVPFGANHRALGVLGRKNSRIARIWTHFHAFADEDVLDGCDWELGDVPMEYRNEPSMDYAIPCTAAARTKVENVRKKRKDELWQLATSQQNPGPLLHYVQDYQSHFKYDNYRGHALSGHWPDFLSADMKKSEAMTEESISVLQRFMQHLRSSKTQHEILPPERKPDRARIKQVLEKLAAVNPAPEYNPANWNPGGNSRANAGLDARRGCNSDSDTGADAGRDRDAGTDSDARSHAPPSRTAPDGTKATRTARRSARSAARLHGASPAAAPRPSAASDTSCSARPSDASARPERRTRSIRRRRSSKRRAPTGSKAIATAIAPP